MDCARAAVANGADAVYFGLSRFNARTRADNFTEAQLPELVRFLHEHGVRAYATLNTLVFTDELADAERELILLDEAEVDAVLVQDIGIAVLARELGVRMEVHASTQMTITSPEGLKFAARLGIKRVVLAREVSLREMARFQSQDSCGSGLHPRSLDVGLEVFVHGALCVAYSGQCLTSEALGQRSANRGECAQACRLPYELVVDGAVKDLGDRRYLLSPQDLAAVKEIPELVRLGVSGFKIEGRLKTPEYVAATCQVYRKAIDDVIGGRPSTVSQADKYKLEMTFSRGLYTGWLHGVNYQELVHARFGKKRGPFVGNISRVAFDHVEIEPQTPLQAGDGVVFDTGGDTDCEQGGRIWEIRDGGLYFARGHIDFRKLKPGDRVWKTSDPKLERELRKTFAGEIPRPKTSIAITVTGAAGEPLTIETDGVRVSSSMALQTALKRPITEKLLRDQLGRLGETDFVLGEIHNQLVANVILPVSELNRLRRELASQLASARRTGVAAAPTPRRSSYKDMLPKRPEHPVDSPLQLVALCRTTEQLDAALEVGCDAIHLDFDDLRRYADAVALIRSRSSLSPSGTPVFLATPRIQKAGEQGFFKLIDAAKPDGVLIRNLGGLDYFRGSSLRKIGDFSLNVANPLSADLLIREGLERVTASYDLNAQQLLDLLGAAPPDWFELTIHQHMPMFHMEHCVFAAFLSDGTDASNCGRPCDRHVVKLRDRMGVEHPVKADAGCRNTVFHAKAQSGADYLRAFVEAGARVFRVELLDEDASSARKVLQGYRGLLDGTEANPSALFRHLNVVKQLGVTSGTLTVLS
jgi:putative protease